MINETLTQRQAIAAGIPPQTMNNGDQATGPVKLGAGGSRRAAFTLYVGAVTGGAVVNAYLQESDDSNTWPANGVASPFSGSAGNGVSLTNITAAGQYTFEVEQKQLTTGKTRVRLQVHTTGGQNVLICVLAEGDDAAQKPGNALNDATVITQSVVS